MKTMTFCALPFQRLKISPEGNVSMCCFQERGCLGNILRTSLEEMWTGPLAQEIREVTLGGRLHKTCQTKSCPFNHLGSLTATEPLRRFDLPVDIELDLPSQHCNIGGEQPTNKNPACLMCERHLYWYPLEDRLQEVCAELKSYMWNVRSLHIQGIAEAFWKDRIFEIFEWLGLQPCDYRVIVSTTTNGTILSEPRRRRFLKYPRSVLTFSIDAATPETYRLIRRVDMFHRVKENLLSYSRERWSSEQILRIHNNINLLNVDEVVGMVELAAEANCEIEFNPTYATPGICVNDWNAYIFKRAEDAIVGAAERLGVFAKFMRRLTLDYEPTQPTYVHQVSSNELTSAAAILGIPVEELLKKTPNHVKFNLPLL